MDGRYFKQRLNYLGERFSGRTAWTTKPLDFVPIAYYRGVLIADNGGVQGLEPLLLYAQAGRSQSELLMNDGMALQAMDRDYFVYNADLGVVPEEDDLILDENYTAFYCKVSSRFTRATFTHVNETYTRMRIRTVVVKAKEALPVPTEIATWLRAGIVPIGYKVRAEIPDLIPEQ